jgi:hydroxymethylbilane synthase
VSAHDDSSPVLRLATRGSALALAQSRQVAGAIEKAHPGLHIHLVTVTTTGDRVQDRPLHDIGGKGLFTKEVEQALLRGEADFAVHSMKDVPVTMPLVPEAAERLVITAVPPRQDVRDVFVSHQARSLAELPVNATVGTTSPRRAAQVLRVRPDLRIVPLRGNVDSRLEKLAAGAIGACLLAAAGLGRLGRFDPAFMHPLDPTDFIPAAGQGALALQCREDDVRVRRILAAVDDVATQSAVDVEREVVRLLEGDCTSPIGVWATESDGHWNLHAFTADADAAAESCRRAGVRCSVDLPARSVAAEVVAALSERAGG